MEKKLRLPQAYQTKLDLLETEKAIKIVRDQFQIGLAQALNLTRVSAPMFVLAKTGLNDNLNGSEQAVNFTSEDIGDETIEIVHSLAKWKRDALNRYGFQVGAGLYTDMNAIRKDEFLDNTHSIYVDQWDWELAIQKEQRTLGFLKETVSKIYGVLREVQTMISIQYPALEKSLPQEITFITSQELEDKYPNLAPEQREAKFARQFGAICILQIGHPLQSGISHGSRSPDYDDWNLNADIIVYHELLDEALELSSLGIRVDAKTLLEQLGEDRAKTPYHWNILNGKLPLTIGGGIGQSRLCMYLLEKAHIGEVQVSIWDKETERLCAEHGIALL